MDTVNNWADLEKNIATLERYSKSTGYEKKFHTQLVKKGTCFIAYEENGEIHFSPSRFVGYANNEMLLHKTNNSKDGRITNQAINKILGDDLGINGGLEFEYKKYCQFLGFIANKTGSFGVARKFWFSKNTGILLNNIKNYSTGDKELVSDLEEISNKPSIGKTEKERLVSARIGQGLYREGLIKYWQKCAVTSCDEIPLLRASHIKPWRYSSDEERLDVFNGLLLSPNLDLLFDKGFITFDIDGKIQISLRLSEKNLIKLGVNINSLIVTHKNHQPYLDWHRKNIFRK